MRKVVKVLIFSNTVIFLLILSYVLFQFINGNPIIIFNQLRPISSEEESNDNVFDKFPSISIPDLPFNDKLPTPTKPTANPSDSNGSGFVDENDNVKALFVEPKQGSIIQKDETFKWSKGQNIVSLSFELFDITEHKRIYQFDNLDPNKTNFKISLENNGHTLAATIKSHFKENKIAQDSVQVKLYDPESENRPIDINSSAKIVSPSTSEHNPSFLNDSTEQFEWVKGTNISKYEFKILDGTNILFEDLNIVNSTTKVTVNNLPDDGRTINVNLKSIFNDNSSITETYTYKSFNKSSNNKSLLKIRAYSRVENSQKSPILKLYLEKLPLNTEIKIEPRVVKTYEVILPKKVSDNKLFSIVFDNESQEFASFNADRNIFIEKVELDDQTIFNIEPTEEDKKESQNFKIWYDRANKENGTLYPEANLESWGDLLVGVWDNVGVSPNSIEFVWWNGAINIIKNK